MTADQGSAEEYMRALARDIAAELVAGHTFALANDFSIEPVDPDSDEPFELAAFNVRGFQRTVTTKSGQRVVENVRPHAETRQGGGGEHFVKGADPGGGREVKGWISQAKWDANKWKKHAKSIDQVHSAVRDTQQQMHGPDLGSVGQSMAQHDSKHPASPLWRQFGQDSRHHLGQAAQQLAHSGADQGKMDQPALGEAYHHLATAHHAGVEQVLPRARTPEEKKNVQAHLDRIQGHMEALDKVAGVDSGMTRKILGTSGQHGERASSVRDNARSELQDAAETGDEFKVNDAANKHQGLLDQDMLDAAKQRAKQVADARNPQVPPLPPYHHGAAAIYPNAGAHARAVTAGGTLSGHENAHRISGMPVAQQQTQTPVEMELAKLKEQTARFAQREAQRRDFDLQAHLRDMKAAEAAYRGQAAEGQYKPLEDAEFAARKDFVASQVETALRAGLATDQQFSMDGKGQVWTPQRATLHAEIVRDFMDSQVDVPTERQALFMGGLPGAGKSTTLNGHPDIDRKNYATLNPDDFKEELMKRGAAPEIPGLAPMETAALVHEESAYLTDLVAHELERRGKNVAWDVTMKNHDITADRIKLLKRKGYTVHAVFVDVPVDKSADRVEQRYRKGLEKYRQGKDEMGGRFIPRHVVLAGEDTPGVSRAKTTFQKLKPEFKSWEHYDGTSYPAKLVDKAGQPSSVIPSIESLRAMSTEQGARAAESGQAAEKAAGLTQTNPTGSMSAEESESR